MIKISFFLTMILFMLYTVLKIFEPRFKVKERMNLFINVERSEGKKRRERSRVSIKEIVVEFRDRAKNYFSQRIPSKKEILLERKLIQAGNPFGISIIDFRILILVLRILLPSIFALYGKLLRISLSGIMLLALIGFVLSIIVPDYYINQKIKQRYKQALKELPDFLDLLTVCLEAGLGFDGALNKVISKKNGVLSSEFHICLEEIRLGKTRKEALTGVKERLDFDELKSLINNILQAEKLGISVVQIFRIKSVEEREKRRQRAEEEAMKAPIRILFPLVLFIFPCIFIILLGPVVLQLMKGFIR